MTRADLNPTSSRPVTAQGFKEAPKSDGPLFPEKSYPQAASPDDRFVQARQMLAGLNHPDIFLANATLKTRNARPFGAFPDEGPAMPVDEAVASMTSSIASAEAMLAKLNTPESVAALGAALEAIHRLGRGGAPKTEEIVAPVHAWLSDDVREEALARLSFSYAELAGEEADQRKVQHYLDLLIEELPDPLKGDATTPRQRLLRMLAHIYMGRSLDRSRTVQEAIRQYETAIEINDLHQKGIEEARFRAYAELIDLHFKRALKLRSEIKFSRSISEVNEIVRLREAIEHRLPLDRPEYRNAMISMREEIGRRFWALGLVAMAHNELYGIQEKYGSATGAQILKDTIDNANLSEARKAALHRHFFDDEGTLKPSDSLGDIPFGTRAAIWLTHTLANARRHKPLKTFMTWLGGAASAAGAVYASTNGDIEFADLLAAAGGGAAIFDGAARLFNGATARETQEARAIGLNDINTGATFANATVFATKTLLPYVIFGGRVPGLGAVSDVPVIGGLIEASQDSAIAAGSLNGLGSVVSGSLSALSSEASTAMLALADPTAQTYGAHLAQTTLGSTLNAAINTYGNAASSIVDGSLFERVGNAAREISGSNGWQLGLDGYQAASLGYYGASRVSPSFRRAFNWIGPAFVPGGLLLAANIGASLGANPGYTEVGPVTLPLNLMGTAAVGAGYQILGQTLIGNRSVREIQWYNVLGAAGIINLYVGASANFAPLHKSETFSQMVAESVGRQVGMLPIIITHGAALMVNPGRFLQNKAARLLAYDHAGNLIRIASGQWDGFLPVLAGVSTGFLVTNSLLGCTFNDLAGSKPAAQSFRTMLANAKGEAGPDVLRAMSRSLRRIPPAAPITKMSLDTLTLPTRVFIGSLRGKRLTNYMLPEENTYAMMHDAMMADAASDGLNKTQMMTFISAAKKFLDRPEDADVARGLMITLSAARRGPHAKEISSFFENNRDVHARLRVPREPLILPNDRAAKKAALYQLLKHPFRVCPEEDAARALQQGSTLYAGIAPQLRLGLGINSALVSTTPAARFMPATNLVPRTI